mmetsp:Transcript_8043/g.19397  ORF Transcript_8043/g.19397 Transcript_8043/m.19397 type:complete len:267 (-) Transcript_8043:1557-2357(-)
MMVAAELMVRVRGEHRGIVLRERSRLLGHGRGIQSVTTSSPRGHGSPDTPEQGRREVLVDNRGHAEEVVVVVVHGLRGGRRVLLVLVVSGGCGEGIVESRRCPGRKLSGMVPGEVSVVVRARSQGHTPGSVRGRSKNLLRRMKGGGGSHARCPERVFHQHVGHDGVVLLRHARRRVHMLQLLPRFDLRPHLVGHRWRDLMRSPTIPPGAPHRRRERRRRDPLLFRRRRATPILQRGGFERVLLRGVLRHQIIQLARLQRGLRWICI